MGPAPCSFSSHQGTSPGQARSWSWAVIRATQGTPKPLSALGGSPWEVGSQAGVLLLGILVPFPGQVESLGLPTVAQVLWAALTMAQPLASSLAGVGGAERQAPGRRGGAGGGVTVPYLWR